MAKVTSKLQVTIPKRIAERYSITPGDEIEFIAAGEGIRILLAGRRAHGRLSKAERLRLFRAASTRQREREKGMKFTGTRPAAGRGWTREDLYTRGKSR